MTTYKIVNNFRKFVFESVAPEEWNDTTAVYKFLNTLVGTSNDGGLKNAFDSLNSAEAQMTKDGVFKAIDIDTSQDTDVLSLLFNKIHVDLLYNENGMCLISIICFGKEDETKISTKVNYVTHDYGNTWELL